MTSESLAVTNERKRQVAFARPAMKVVFDACVFDALCILHRHRRDTHRLRARWEERAREGTRVFNRGGFSAKISADGPDSRGRGATTHIRAKHVYTPM